MRKIKLLSGILMLAVGLLFLSIRLFAQSSVEKEKNTPVRSPMATSSESSYLDECISGSGYCIVNGYAVNGILIKN